jgi:4-hydroxy-2-oxoheptanedioate aldolase
MTSFKATLGKEVKFGAFVSNVTWPGYIDLLAKHHYDFVVIDTEHGSFGYDQVQALVQYAKLYGLYPVIRVADKQYHLVARALDMGTSSVMMPVVETAQEVENLLSWAKYPPQGKRGAGSFGIILDNDKSRFIQDVNDDGVVIIQIETKKGLENLDEILKFPAVDVVFIGPLDLSLSLGIPGDFKNPILHQAFTQIIEKCQRAGKCIGIMCNPEDAPHFIEQGVNFLAIGIDVGFLQSALRQAMAVAKGEA